MERIEAHLKSMQMRTLASIAVYVVFAALAAWMGARGTSMQREGMLVWMAPLVGAIVLLPRDVYPTAWPTAESDDQDARIDMIRDTLTQLHSRVIAIRLVYMVLAAVFVGLLPRLGV